MLKINGVASFYELMTVLDLFVGRDLTVKRNVIVKEYVTQVGGITIIPLTAGAKALTVRDAGDTADKIVLKEDGSLSLSPLTPGSVLFAGSGGLVSQDNANLFWDNANKRLGIGTTTPAEKLHVVGNVRADAIINTVMNGLRSYAGTSKTVTETTATVKDEVGPLANRVSLLPMVVKYSANNPTGSGATLYVTLRAVYTDGTTTDIDSRSLAAGTSVDVAITGEALYDLLADGKILQKIQLLAYCSTTPATGYEPSVTLSKVAGVSM